MFAQTPLYFAPDEPTGGTPEVAATPAAPASLPDATPSVQAAPDESAASAAATTSTPSATAAAPSAPAQPSWLDGLRKQGWQGTETNEEKIQQQLVQAWKDAEQLRPIAPHATQFMQHADDFKNYLAEKQKVKPVADTADWTEKLGWKPPPWDPNWRHLVTKDEKGNLVPVPGAPFDVVQKYQAAQAFREEQVEKLLANPFKFMEPAIKHIATEIAQQHAQQGVGQYREQIEAKQFVDTNSAWIYENDGKGGIKTAQRFNPETGKHENVKVMTQYGNMFLERINDYARRGLDSDSQRDLAMRDVQFAYSQTPEGIAEMSKRLGGQPANPANVATNSPPPQSPREAANAAFLKNQNPPGKRPGSNGNPSPPAINRMNYQQEMLRELREAGATA